MTDSAEFQRAINLRVPREIAKWIDRDAYNRATLGDADAIPVVCMQLLERYAEDAAREEYSSRSRNPTMPPKLLRAATFALYQACRLNQITPPDIMDELMRVALGLRDYQGSHGDKFEARLLRAALHLAKHPNASNGELARVMGVHRNKLPGHRAELEFRAAVFRGDPVPIS